MEYNPLCYKPDDVKRFVLERCITAQEGLEMLMEMEQENFERILSFSLLMGSCSSFDTTLTLYRLDLYQLQ